MHGLRIVSTPPKNARSNIAVSIASRRRAYAALNFSASPFMQ